MFKRLKLLWKEVISEVVISKEKTFSMNIEKLKKKAELLHPVGFYILANKLFNEGKKDESIFWFYVGSIRYRYFLSSIGDDPFHPKKHNPGALEDTHKSMQELRKKLVDEKDDILRQRIENGSEIRV